MAIPDISSGPSADREDPPQNNPRLTLQRRRTCSVYATSLDVRVIIGVITIHPPTQPLYWAKGKRQTLQLHHPRGTRASTPTFRVLSCVLRSILPGFLSVLVFSPQAMQMQMRMRMHTRAQM
ncbi:hypothetical protein N7519_008648 [Penicillium mononematosum]|uniref:uncharacterized protein n=1 Tax=Penicillium mononematosum TaxID=268346 RepID=UPI0025487F54|nr:uncharacterized protein N7519_008648 [Penicillium mononematosum]KAJ6178187.1 hypothetical protein N7519_008648 [Penicillium mononematosum]